MKSKNYIPTITIGIAAYNAERNIVRILNSLLKQKVLGLKIDKIIVHSDNSSDKTVYKVREINDNRVLCIESKTRVGFVGSLEKILKKSTSDITVLLNDDIKIRGEFFLQKVIRPFLRHNGIGLVCAHPVPLSPVNFLDSAITSGFNAYDKIRYQINFGNNVHTVDGKVLCISKRFKRKISFNKNMGNVDGYLYFLCMEKGFKYYNAKKATVYYRNPTRFNDYIRWYVRNASNKFILKKRFGPIVDVEYKFPKSNFLFYKIKEGLRNPLGALFIFLTSFYINYKSKIYTSSFSSTWDVVTSTKEL